MCFRNEIAGSHNFFGKDVSVIQLRNQALLFIRENTIVISKIANKVFDRLKRELAGSGAFLVAHKLESAPNHVRKELLALGKGLSNIFQVAVVGIFGLELCVLLQHSVHRSTGQSAGVFDLLCGVDFCNIRLENIFKTVNTISKITPEKQKERSKSNLCNIQNITIKSSRCVHLAGASVINQAQRVPQMVNFTFLVDIVVYPLSHCSTIFIAGIRAYLAPILNHLSAAQCLREICCYFAGHTVPIGLVYPGLLYTGSGRVINKPRSDA